MCIRDRAEELYFFGGGFSRISRKSDTFDFSRLDSDLTAKESISSEKANFIAGWRPDWDLSVLSPEFRGLVTKHSLTSSSYYAEIIGIGPELRSMPGEEFMDMQVIILTSSMT